MTWKKRLLIGLVCTAVCWGAAFMVSCVSTGSVEAMQQRSSAMHEELDKMKQDLVVIDDPVDRAVMEARIDEAQRITTIFDDALQDAEDGTDSGLALLEAGLMVAGGFFPPLTVGVPLIRSYRRQRKSIFAAVDAGGGVKDPINARRVLTKNPAAYNALQRHQKNGN